MKRILTLALLVSLLVGFGSCSESNDNLPENPTDQTDPDEDKNGGENEDPNGDDEDDPNGGDEDDPNDDPNDDYDIESIFPDPIFRAYVLANFDSDKDGRISEEEASQVWQIDVSKDVDTPDEGKIKTLEGIQIFSNLTNLLCYNNLLTDLDISKNTALSTLNCNRNPLNTLDVSNNTALTILSCWRTQLTALDVTKNTALLQLDCYMNQLTDLDLSHNTALIRLSCHENLLTSLDLSHNTALRILSCSENQLTSLDISKTDMNNGSLYCVGNPLEKVYIKTGWEIIGVTYNRDLYNNIPDQTEIVYVD